MPSLFTSRKKTPTNKKPPRSSTNRQSDTTNVTQHTFPTTEEAPPAADTSSPANKHLSPTGSANPAYYPTLSPKSPKDLNISVKSFPNSPMTSKRLREQIESDALSQKRVLSMHERRLIHDNLQLARNLEEQTQENQTLTDSNHFLVHKCETLEDENERLRQRVSDLERGIQEYRYMRVGRVRLCEKGDEQKEHKDIVRSPAHDENGHHSGSEFTTSKEVFIDTMDLVKDLDGAFGNHSAMKKQMSNSSTLSSIGGPQNLRAASSPNSTLTKRTSSSNGTMPKNVQDLAANPSLLPPHAASPLDITTQNSKIFTYVAEKSNEIQWNTETGFPDLRAYQRAIAQLITKYQLNESIPDKQLTDLNLLRRNHLQHMIFEQYRMWVETDSMEGKYPTSYRRPVVWYPYWRSGRAVMGWISEGSAERVHVKTEYFSLPEIHQKVLSACCKAYYEEAQKRYDRGDRQFIEDTAPALFMNCTIDYTLESNQKHVDNHKHIAYVYIAHTKVVHTHKEHEVKVKNILAHFYNTSRMNTFVTFEGAQVIHLVLALNWLKDPKTFPERSKIFAIHKFPNAKYQTVADMKKKENDFVVNMGLR
eukprot:CAMPEP_0117438868 /NCGR_PEP_ID=MMETSP0759-20121206/2276_1 /TAXON_ID=63605 /ORGANISM="Percolomonas cosmopolitus, Strain WS" /LENGTH=590 /DNA_ID=CAMNT_0005230575 /DNA_START=95 /DNA_END=1864 /DNA_ORIENTATION=+